MIRFEIAGTKEINICANNGSVEIHFKDYSDDNSYIEMPIDSAELLLTRLMEALNKIERRV